MYRALARWSIRRKFAHLNAGRLERFLAMFTDASVFYLAGDHELGGVRRGRVAIRELFELMRLRFTDLSVVPVTVVVQGWPWNTGGGTRLRIRASCADGTVYRNDGLQMAYLRWGRAVEEWIYEDVDVLRDGLANVQRETHPPLRLAHPGAAPRLCVRPSQADPSDRQRSRQRFSRSASRPPDVRHRDVQSRRHSSGDAGLVRSRRRSPLLPAEASSGKARRLRGNRRVRVAPCTTRGRPLGPALLGSARVLEHDRVGAAEALIQSAFGFGRAVYERTLTHPDGVYVEVIPDGGEVMSAGEP